VKRLIEHEIQQMSLLQWLGSNRFLSSLVLGHESMLRLCHELPRYTRDLRFCFFKEKDYDRFYDQIYSALAQDHDLANAENNFHSIFLEVMGNEYSNKLTIEIEKTSVSPGSSEEKIAYSPHFPNQVLVRGLTLKQVLKSKVTAFIDGGNIQDAFDLAFFLMKGTVLDISENQKKPIISRLKGFNSVDFDIKLRGLLLPEMKDIYLNQGFKYMEESLS
jgi:hypothetical protein